VLLAPASDRALGLGPALFLALCMSGPAQAQDAVRLEVIRAGMVGGSSPSLVVHPQVDLRSLDIHLSCGGTPARYQGVAHLGEAVAVPIPAPEGRHACTGSLAIRLSDDSEGELPLSFDIEVLPALALRVDRADLDLATGSVVIHANRPLQDGEARLQGEAGELARGGSTGTVDGGLRLQWDPPADTVLEIAVSAKDQHGFAAGLDLFPWSYSVPHEDVVFATGQAEVRPEEVTKLEAAWVQVQQVQARYGTRAPVNLYVAGYTDTVGGAEANQRLSEARAQAIARWFQGRGFTGTISYQGLGEGGLVVPTPDEVDEARNRRADYIIAAETPPVGPLLPTSAWKPLR